MLSQQDDCAMNLPFHVLRWVREFGPRMRGGLIRCLQARQAIKDKLTVQDMCECIDTAWAMLQMDAESRVQFPAADAERVRLAQQEAREGRGSSIDEILNALP